MRCAYFTPARPTPHIRVHATAARSATAASGKSTRPALRATTNVSCRLNALAGAHAAPVRLHLGRDEAVRSGAPTRGAPHLASRASRQDLRWGLMTSRSPKDWENYIFRLALKLAAVALPGRSAIQFPPSVQVEKIPRTDTPTSTLASVERVLS
jgi:hypothetical protein